MGRFIDRTGERFINNNNLGSYEFIIIEYNRSDDVWVEFQDEYKARIHTNMNACRNGEVKNPYHRSLDGVACLGLMSDGSKPITTYGKGIITKEYRTWKSMINRCYNEGALEYCSSYKDATVCDRWLVFANFLEDLPLIEGYELWINNDGYALDKDIKGNGSKIYCLENCCFISQNDNSIESYNRNRNKIHKELNKSVEEQKIKVYGINIKTGERTRDFNSMTEASKEIGINKTSISRSIKGKQKTCGGYKWFKVES